MQDKMREQQIAQHNSQVRGWLFLLGWLVTCVAVIVIYRYIERPDLRFWEGTVTHGNPDVRQVALTFDDGPHPLWAPLLADTLEQHGARGTFCLVGSEAQRYPEITARLAEAGHQIVSHSMTHPYPNLTALPERQIAIEVLSSTKLLSQLTGQPIHDFRPPGGGVNDQLIEVLLAHHLQMDWWSTNVGDWNSPTPKVIAERLHASLRPGLVVLMHERSNSLAALDHFFLIGNQGYTYTTLSTMMRQ